MFKTLHKKVKDSIFSKAWDAVMAKPKLFLYIFLLDLAFFAVFFLFNQLFNLILPSDPSFVTRLQADTLLFIAVIILVVVYFVISVIVYSFFSLVILGNIKKMSVEHDHDFSMFKRMFGLNLILIILFILLLVLFNIVSAALASLGTWVGIFVLVVFIVLALLAYAFYNFTHSAFILKHELKDSLKAAFKHILTKSYLGILLFSLIVIGAYIILYFLVGLVFKDAIIKNYESFVNISSIIAIILVYLLFSFNRIYFFFVAEKHIGHKVVARPVKLAKK